MKRLFDILFASIILVILSPVILGALFLVWIQDFHSPIYWARRVGLGNRDFRMMKIRSMAVDADRSGVNSTSANDTRITPVGHYIRRFKLDELSQFWNVLRGDMSVVGPRPNTRGAGVDLYTPLEMRLLDVRPGITDLASIVFSDEGDILHGSDDPDGLYNAIIRPWKSRLGLLYIQRRSLALDLKIAWLTALAIVSKASALRGVRRILVSIQAEPDLIAVCARQAPLPAASPPGAPAPAR